MTVFVRNSPSICLLFVLWSCLPSPIAAQSVTLRHAVELALTHSAAGADAEQARAYAGYRESRAAYLPRVVLGSGLGGSYGFPLSLENAAPSLFNIASQQVLFSAAQKSFVQAARGEWQATKIENQDQRNALIEETALTYVELNKWNQEIDLLKTELTNNQKIERIEQERVDAGVDPAVERTKARLASARVQLRLAEAEGSADVLRLRLAQLTGLSAAELVTDPDSIPTLPDRDPDRDLAVTAAEASPAVKAAEQHALAKRFTAEGEYRALLPSVDIAGQYALLSNFNNYQVFIRRFQHNNASGGLVLRLPFFDGVQRARAAQAKAEAIRSARQAAEAKQKVSLETIRLQRSVQELGAAAEVAEIEYELAQSQLATAEARMKAETGTLREEQDARSKVEQSYDSLIDAHFALDKAKVQLLRQTGELEQWARSGK